MTRNFFNRVLAAGSVVTRRYSYNVETSNHLRKIVRYSIGYDGDGSEVGYVCAVYSA